MLVENNPFRFDPRVRQEADALVKAGYRVSAICPADARRVWRESVDGVKVYAYPAPPPGTGLLSYAWEYGYSLAATFVLSLLAWMDSGFDILHTANPPDTAVFMAWFYKIFGVRFIFDHHDLAPEMYWERFEEKGSRIVYKSLLEMERLSCRAADQIIATNESYKKIEMERHHVPEKRITIVRNGPRLDKFHTVPSDLALKQKGKIILGFVGVMARQDGVDYLLRALHHLVHDLKRDDFYCVIIGRGSALPELKALAAQLGLNDHVWFTGFIPDEDMLRYLSTADICIDPDPSNAFNDRCTMIKMMEYMAMGKPIVAFDLPEHRVSGGEAAVYAKPNEELDLARKIAELMDDPERRARMGQLGRQRVEADLNWDRQAGQLIRAYETLAPRSGA